jgi:hypothetical protein
MTPAQVTSLGQALLSEVFKKSIPSIRATVAAAGIDASRIPAESERQGGSGSRAEIVPVIQRLFGELSLEQQTTALPILAQSTRPGSERLMGQHGFEFRNGAFVPVGLLDDREARYLPRQSRMEISAAFDRLVRGDESGAITKACGAVESLARAAYEKNGWNDMPDSFQAKVNTVVKRLRVFDNMRTELSQISMRPEDIEEIVKEMRETTNHAAHALQVIRRAMGDVHGTKPALTRTVYDSIKWASAICGLLEDAV